MLPIAHDIGGGSGVRSLNLSSRLGNLSLVPQYLRRMTRFSQMDMEYTFSQMVYLCKSPSKVYTLTKYRKQTKNQWARDDPAFVFIMVLLVTTATVAYRVGFGGAARSYGIIALLLYSYIQCLGVGAVVASAGWGIANKYMRIELRQGQHTVEQMVEWLYAFDIHCNSFFPVFIILYVIQYFLAPLLLAQGFFACFFANTLYAISFIIYAYITFLGYMTLPFLQHTEWIIYLALVVVIPCWLISVILQVNATRFMFSLLF